MAYRSSGRWSEAEFMYKRILAINPQEVQKIDFGVGVDDCSSSLSKLAEVLVKQSKLSEAANTYKLLIDHCLDGTDRNLVNLFASFRAGMMDEYVEVLKMMKENPETDAKWQSLRDKRSQLHSLKDEIGKRAKSPDPGITSGAP